MVFNLLFSLFTTLLALNPQTHEWKKWQDKTFEESLSSPTSFLNAYALSHGKKGDSLYLILKKDIHKTHWTKNKPKQFYAMAESLGDSIRLKINDRTEAYLSLKDGKRKKDFQLPNGAIARIVLGRRNKKMWAYLFDPNQIKRFTGFRFYPYNPNAITEGFFKKIKPKLVGYKTVQGDSAKTYKIGNVSFKLNGIETYLSAYSWSQPPLPTQAIELIFVDETAGKETYGGGRGLTIHFESPLRDGQKFKIDFNKTINFYCAHSPFWHCPVGLQEPIRGSLNAGEMLPLKRIVSR